ncbi:hypothetical protein KCU67_g23, partial [Aureobasidium melanogenum]
MPVDDLLAMNGSFHCKLVLDEDLKCISFISLYMRSRLLVVDEDILMRRTWSSLSGMDSKVVTMVVVHL